MAKGMKIVAVIALLLTAAFIVLYQLNPTDLLLTLAITAGTTAYHFLMRLTVGKLFDLILKNKVDYSKKWFRVGKTEVKLYKLLRVKRWKEHLPTYDPSVFDPKIHSWDEIAQATCQSELVHETIAVLSFLPVFVSPWLGSALVFLLTSVISALFDLSFVAIQRYNRPRILRLRDAESRHSKS